MQQMNYECCMRAVYDSNGLGCAPCGSSFPCAEHPGETPCKHCRFSRDLHQFRHDYPNNSGICSNFVPAYPDS
jgi:hypothetical protein